ncbi:MAG: T9SS type A sorting domain-containing protein [Aureispira sp.]|nr:T9SS type A sorting domain-containing protein [Aureispira sp.]
MNSLKNLFAVLLFSSSLSFSALAQSTQKPDLELKVEIDNEKQEMDVIWPYCLENTVVSLMDNNLNVLKVKSLCKTNNRINISKWKRDLYYVKLEHYTGEAMISVMVDHETKIVTQKEQVIIDFEVTPNPAQSIVTVIGDEHELREAKLELMDATGKVIKNVQIQSSRTELDISDLANGIYFIRVEQQKGIGVKKIIKN